MPTRTRGALAFALASGAIVLSGLGGCAGDADSDRLKYDAECWMGIRSLHATGLTYVSSSFDRAFDDLRYWRICYDATRAGVANLGRICEIRIDQTGRVVYPLGCI